MTAAPLRNLWTLDPDAVFLNHGSFGACPRAVLEHQSDLRAEIERQPVEFFARNYNDRLDAARREIASFLGADPDGLVAVPNATTGANAVLRSLSFREGDELLTTDHAYNACRNALEFVADRCGARVVVAPIPFPVRNPDDIVDTIVSRVTPRTRMALVDHITSPTALVLPIEAIVEALHDRGVDVLVDGAHAPGMVPLDLDSLGVSYYVGNCHKWLCAPKGAGFLYVRDDRRNAIRPVTISHGASARRDGRTRFHDEFDWVGTDDPTPFLCVPRSIEYLASVVDGGWDAIRARNHALAVAARDRLASSLRIDPPCPDTMLGSMAAVPLPDGDGSPPRSALYTDPLQDELRERFRIEVPIAPWPAPPRRVLRVSAQLYNRPEDYDVLAEGLQALLAG